MKTTSAESHELLTRNAEARVVYLETIGRVTSRPRRIEIWFATDGERIYLLAGGRDGAHWVRNLRVDPRVRVRIGGRTVAGTARIIEGTEHDQLARELLAAKYQGWTPGLPLSRWAAGSLPVEILPD